MWWSTSRTMNYRMSCCSNGNATIIGITSLTYNRMYTVNWFWIGTKWCKQISLWQLWVAPLDRCNFTALFVSHEDEKFTNKGDIIETFHTLRTGVCTYHNYKKLICLRFAMYTNNDVMEGLNNTNSKQFSANIPSVCTALKNVYPEIWLQCVVRSLLY